ncbi:helix-turn-helix domain-containing protein [Kitasatospora sp. NBC_01250]|uniref:helix-turn-helix domain-containing protein n=1 Tax=Kitasatospora sp. NBC_01250 TaxID=2903571 RepID=UPI002E2EFB41|nr:helix-turn-helix transcriptional regulator [Kitasatospora sp. NBC_01250]
MTVPEGQIPEQPIELDDDEAADESQALSTILGKQLKILRERKGLTQRELAVQLGYSEDLISSIERGRRNAQEDLLIAADDFLDAGGLLKAGVEDTKKAKKPRVRHPVFFRDYARLEPEAVELSYYSTMAVPGLLQTPEYARHLFNVRRPLWDEQTIEWRLAARLARQEIMNRKWPPPMVSCLIEESVLQRPIGGRQIQKGQLESLLTFSTLRNGELQVMPTSCQDHTALDGSFTLLTPKGGPQVGYVEVQQVSRLITDFEEVRLLAAKYGTMRAQALTPRESQTLIEKMLGEL